METVDLLIVQNEELKKDKDELIKINKELSNEVNEMLDKYNKIALSIYQIREMFIHFGENKEEDNE
jgi:hypothetical protein